MASKFAEVPVAPPDPPSGPPTVTITLPAFKTKSGMRKEAERDLGAKSAQAAAGCMLALTKNPNRVPAGMPKANELPSSMPRWAKEMLLESYEEVAVRQQEKAERNTKQQAEWVEKLHSKEDFWSKVTEVRHMAGGLDSLGAWRFMCSVDSASSSTVPSDSKELPLSPLLRTQLSDRVSTGPTLVVKGISQESSIEEWFADVLFRLAGISTPDNLKVVNRYDAEYERIRVSGMCNFLKNEELRHKLHTLFKPGVVHVMDFVSGRGWWDGYSINDGWPKRVTPVLEAATLQALARIIAMDMLVNNYDRLPLGDAWMNEGNLANILFVGKGVVAIDQKVNAIEHPEGFSMYFNGVKTVVQQVRTQERPKCVLAFQKFVRRNQYEMNEAGISVFKLALSESFDFICREFSAPNLSALVAKHKKLYTGRGMDASFLNEEFVLQMLPAFV